MHGLPWAGNKSSSTCVCAPCKTHKVQMVQESMKQTDIRQEPSLDSLPARLQILSPAWDVPGTLQVCRNEGSAPSLLKFHVIRCRPPSRGAATNSAGSEGAAATGGRNNGKGLRHFSMKVCEKVESKGRTTYNEVADELVGEFSGAAHTPLSLHMSMSCCAASALAWQPIASHVYCAARAVLE